MNYDRLLTRYIQGLIKNQGASNRHWLKAYHIRNPFDRMVVEELYDMWAKKSVMSPELVIERLVRAAKNHGVDENLVYTLVSDSIGSDVSAPEVMELHDALIKHEIEASARTTLMKLMSSIGSPGAIDEALEIMRNLKGLQPSPIVDLVSQVNVAIQDVEKGANALIPYGIKRLDKNIGGIYRKEICVLAGRPGHGKTSLACQFVLNILDQGYKVMIISKEMDASRLIHKLIANRSNLTSKDIMLGELTEDQRKELHRAGKALCEAYDGRLLLFDDVYDSAKVETLVARHRPDIVVDDYLQLSQYVSDNGRVELNRLLKHYKIIAKTYDVGMFCLSQLNRDIEKREDPRPRLSDLAESGTIEQIAATVAFVFYGHAFDHTEYPPDKVELIVDKSRYGKRLTVELLFDGEHMRYLPAPGKVQ